MGVEWTWMEAVLLRTATTTTTGCGCARGALKQNISRETAESTSDQREVRLVPRAVERPLTSQRRTPRAPQLDECTECGLVCYSRALMSISDLSGLLYKLRGCLSKGMYRLSYLCDYRICEPERSSQGGDQGCNDKITVPA